MESKVNILSKIRIPEFCMSHWLLRIPLAIIFIQQGLMNIPVDIEEAASYGLSYLVWWFVAYGELLGGIGLIVGGVFQSSPPIIKPRPPSNSPYATNHQTRYDNS